MTLIAGTNLGPYKIQSVVGAGGMGEVYRAHDSRLDRTVAIKVLPTSFSADRDRLQRFAQEARAAAALNHPNILSIFDIGDQAGAPYVVSELLEGETLRDRLKTGPISNRKAIDYALQVARGLAAAHEKGIVHRDLKPENLFLTNDGRVKILDFGLAKLTRPESQGSDGDLPTIQGLTEPGLIMGTAGYMSPEQVRGKPADQRSDIFAFGAILHEMISGERAFRGDTAADTMSAILKEEPPELSETGRPVPPGLERIVRHCLEKNPAERFHSARDLAFALEALTEISAVGKSGAQEAIKQTSNAGWRRSLIAGTVAIGLATMAALSWWVGKSGATAPTPEYQQITFRTGSMGNARFTPDGSIVYAASWEGGDRQIYTARTDDTGSRELGIRNADLLSISKNGELAIRLNTVSFSGYARSGTLARVPLNGGTPREVLDNVQDAEWAADGENMAVVRYVPADNHWHLEYPVGHVLLDSINWIGEPRISPDGKWVAFADHENPGGDDEGSIAVIASDGNGQEKKLSSGWSSVEGIVWSPGGKEIWFTSSDTGSANNLRGVTLEGKLRTIVNVPGGMWLQDIRNGVALTETQRHTQGIRGTQPGGTEEHELGWLGWSYLRDLSQDGKKVLFEEQADGGGPNYTVFLRDTDGSPPVRIGEGEGRAISPDNKWVITKPNKGGPMSVVPTGAGAARQLTHDNIRYNNVRYLDAKQLLASGIEAGHGRRNYLIDLRNGDAKPITPEGIAGTILSPDGRSVVVLGPDGNSGIWPMDGSGLRPIPGFDSKYVVTGWTPDGASLYAFYRPQHKGAAKIFRINLATGKMEFWKTFGADLAGTGVNVGAPHFSSDGSAYVYNYTQVLSEAYAVKGLK
jgi:eukaryotic-like serine/threonine-protein kinase